jgi:hypothetical protein
MLSKLSNLFVRRRPQGARRPGTARAGKPWRRQLQLEMLETRLTPSRVVFGDVTQVLEIHNESVSLRPNGNGSTTIFIEGRDRGTDTSHKIYLTTSGGSNAFQVDNRLAFTDAAISTDQFGLQAVTVGPPFLGSLYTLTNDGFASKALLMPPGHTNTVTLANRTNSLAGLGGWRVDGGGNASTLNVSDAGSARGDTYQISGDQVSLPNGRGSITAYSRVGTLNLFTGAGDSTVKVSGAAAGTALNVRGGAGNDTFVISSLDAVKGHVTVDGRGGINDVFVNDSDVQTRDTYTINASTVTWRNSLGLTYSGALRLFVFGSPDFSSRGADVYNVQSTSAQTILQTGFGANTVNVGQGNLAGGLDRLQGLVEVRGNGTNAVVVNDQGGTASDGYAVTSDSVTRGGFGGLNYGRPASLTLNGSNGGAFYDIQSTAPGVATTINGGPGGNVFYVASVSQSLTSLEGHLTVNGGGADALVVFDTANANDETYAFNSAPSRLSLGSVPLSVDFSGMASVYLQTNGHSTVNDPSGAVLVDVLS